MFIRKDMSIGLPIPEEVDTEVKAFDGVSSAPKEKLNLVRLIVMSQFDSTKHEIRALQVPFISDHLMEPLQTQAFIHKLATEKKFIADVVSLPGLKTEVGISILIGANQMWKVVLNDVWSHDEVTGLAAINANLDWTFQGRVPCNVRIFKEAGTHICMLRTEANVSEAVQNFWI